MYKEYISYHALISDFGSLSSILDVEKTLVKAPYLSFYTKDGLITLAGSFQVFLMRVKEVLGIDISINVCKEIPNGFLIHYNKYEPVVYETPDVVEESAEVVTPAKASAARRRAKAENK